MASLTLDDVSQYHSEDDEGDDVGVRQLEQSQDRNEDALAHQVNDAADAPDKREVRVAVWLPGHTCSHCTPRGPSGTESSRSCNQLNLLQKMGDKT